MWRTRRRATRTESGARSCLARYRLRARFRAAVAMLSLAAATPAQDPAPPPELVLQNLAPAARTEGVAVVVPFARGAVKDTPAWHVPDTPTAWQPFGARWPDGSLRQALCLFVAEVPAIGEKRVVLAAGPGPELPAGDIVMPAAKIEVVVVTA